MEEMGFGRMRARRNKIDIIKNDDLVKRIAALEKRIETLEKSKQSKKKAVKNA